MTEAELVAMAQAYVALSNAHRADLIESLFHADAVYRSEAVGEHRGRAAIADMMRGFFDAYPDVHWQASDYACRQRRVAFDFSLRATSPRGDSLERSGHETIDFDSRGYIVELEVKLA